MIIHIEICDVCKRINRGGLPVQTFRHVSNPTRPPIEDDSWDVGPCCQQKAFMRVRGTDVTKNHLLARIEALIITELSLLESGS